MRPYKDPDEFIKALGAEEYQKLLLRQRLGIVIPFKFLRKEKKPLCHLIKKSRFLLRVGKIIIFLGKTGGRDEEVTEASSYKAYRGAGIVFTHRGYLARSAALTPAPSLS